MKPRLDAELAEDGAVVITDTRPAATAPRHELTGVAARVYLLCDVNKTMAALLRDPELADRADDVQAAIDELLSHRLLVCDEDRYLSLAVIRNRSAVVVSGEPSVAAAA